MPTPVVLLGASLAAPICSHAESFLFFVVKTLNRRCMSNTDKRGETKKTYRHGVTAGHSPFIVQVSRRPAGNRKPPPGRETALYRDR
jgi:hypothetical protein